jgi:hypothetical protein
MWLQDSGVATPAVISIICASLNRVQVFYSVAMVTNIRSSSVGQSVFLLEIDRLLEILSTEK